MRRSLALAGMGLVLTLAGCEGSLVQAKREFSFSRPWQDCARVEVRSTNGRVEIRHGTAADVQISGVARAGGVTLGEAEQNVARVEVNGVPDAAHPGTFLVEVIYPYEMRNKSPGADVLVQVPKPCPVKVTTSNGSIEIRKMQGDLNLETSNGGIHVAENAGPVQASTSNGRIAAEGVQGDFHAETSNGAIDLDKISGSCDLRTSNGGIQLKGLTGSVKAETSNGGIEATLAPPADGRVELGTSNGGIHLILPKALAATLKFATTNGHVNANLDEAALKVAHRSKSDLSATYNGGGANVSADTSNGSITVETR